MKTDAKTRQPEVIPVFDAESMREATTRVLDQARAQIAEMENLPIEQVGPDLLDAWDRRSVLLEDVIGPVALLNSVHPDRTVRDEADRCLLEVSSFTTELFQSEPLYQRVRAVRPETPAQEKFQRDLLESFEDYGVALPPDRRARFKEINDRLVELDQEFERNIRDNETRLEFGPSEITGLPDSYLERVPRTADGGIRIGFDYPEFNPFMANAANEEARRRYYTGYMRRGTGRNLEILEEIGRLRMEIAELYDLPSYAHYVTRRRMVETPETVHRFLDEVRSVVLDVERRELEELREVKAAHLGLPPDQVEVHAWDLSWCRERVRERRFAIDQEKLRKYFPTDASVEWVLEIASRLYGIEFHSAAVPLWHPDVTCYDVIDSESGASIGGIYLDLFPRDGKYKHAAAWPVRGVSTRLGRKPISVLVTNFDRKGLTHGELETLLHEMGHVFHGVLSSTEYLEHAGTSVERDFVEAPSQMFEEWGHRIESLALFREVCPSCPAVDAELVARLDAARRFGKGIHYARQHLYASFDMAQVGPELRPPLEIWRELEEATPTGHPPDTEFPGTFSHIAGSYASGYYGYMWSEVLALDMLSAFDGEIMNPEVGRRFREEILARGSEEPAKVIVERFLGRPSDPTAFFAEISGTRE